MEMQTRETRMMTDRDGEQNTRANNDDRRERYHNSPNRIFTYFQEEWQILALVTVSGLIYNVGLLAGPWFEGRMAGCLIRILRHRAHFQDMLMLTALYVLVIAIVQISRYLKRLYVRRFANNVNRRMKEILYGNLVRRSRQSLVQESAGDVMTKAILDVDDCVEGMRKFTTEIFDTGVALVAYGGMLLYYDWRLALLGMTFTLVSYFLAEKMKTVVQRAGAEYKVQSGRLSTATLDRAINGVTYRVYGCQQERRSAYEKELQMYEKSAVRANTLASAMQPLYRVISLTGVLFILYYGGRNVLGTGWTQWSIAVFTTFLSCFTKMAIKSSSAAKLFNAVHKAQVSWKRIKPMMQESRENSGGTAVEPESLVASNLGFTYSDGTEIYRGMNFTAEPGQIIGVTGPVASGKSTFGRTFLCEQPYRGSLRFGGVELSEMAPEKRTVIVGYLGHDPELFDDTVKNNILLGQRSRDVQPYLQAVCLDREVRDMELGVDTVVGSSSLRLSGGQAQRLALARTLCHARPVLILDDPFSALDRGTEREVFQNLKEFAADGIVILISHRLYLFPALDQVIWMAEGTGRVGTHQELMISEPEYRKLYQTQEGGQNA